MKIEKKTLNEALKVLGKVVQAKYPHYIRRFQVELCRKVCDILSQTVDETQKQGCCKNLKKVLQQPYFYL